MRNVTIFDGLVDQANAQAGDLELIRLQRFDNETDMCEECEEAIHPKRLAALPGVTTCLDCQTQFEQEGVQFKVKAV